MRRSLLHLLTLLLCLPGFNKAGHAADPAVMDDDAIMAFLDDPDSLLGMLDEPPPGEPIPTQESPSIFVVTSSVGAGIGHSNNFLKKNQNLLAGDYLQLEADTYATWSKDSLEISALGFVETTLYDVEQPESVPGIPVEKIPSDEITGFAQLKGLLSRDTFDFGVEGSFLYASFIYDSSIPGVNASAGTNIRQIMPELKLFMDWYAPGANRIRFGVSGARVQFNLTGQDFWDSVLNAELEHAWSKTLATTTGMDISRQFYDDDYPKYANSNKMDNSSLAVNRLALYQGLSWAPGQIKWLKMNLVAGVAWEDEDHGYYEAMRQAWIKGTFNITNSWGSFKIAGRWGEYRYDHRFAGSIDPRLNLPVKIALQTSRTLTIEYRRSLKWGFEIIARNQWSLLSSRVYRDNFSERRTELLVEWSY